MWICECNKVGSRDRFRRPATWRVDGGSRATFLNTKQLAGLRAWAPNGHRTCYLHLAMGALLKFGPFELNAEEGELRKLGAPVRLRRQGIRVLTCLADRPSEVVTRDELREVLWGSQIFVDFREGLNTCVKELRMALGDDADRPLFIQTVPRQGYRFIARVERVNGTNGGSDRKAPQAFSSDIAPPSTQYLDV